MSNPKPTPDVAFKEFLKHTSGVLRGHGFMGSGQNFRREQGAQWQAINLQKSQWRCKDDPIRFYINIGIDYPTLDFKRWVQLPETLSKFSAMKADTQFRIDELLPDERLDWFACEGVDGWNLEAFTARFEQFITKQLVPLLDAMATPAGLARVLRARPWMVAAGARAFIGKDLSPPTWDLADRDAGKWKQDEQGLWWRHDEHQFPRDA